MKEQYPLNIVMQTLRAERTAQLLPGVVKPKSKLVKSSVPELAIFLGLGVEELLSIESGEIPTPPDFVDKVCAFFGIDRVEFDARIAAAEHRDEVGIYGDGVDFDMSVGGRFSPAHQYLADYLKVWNETHTPSATMRAICEKSGIQYFFFYHLIAGDKKNPIEYGLLVADTMQANYGWGAKERSEFLRAMRLSQKQRTIDLGGVPMEMRAFVNHFLSNYMNLDARDVQFVMQVIDNARRRGVDTGDE